MSFLDTLKKSVRDVTQSLNTELKKFRSKELLQAMEMLERRAAPKEAGGGSAPLSPEQLREEIRKVYGI